MTVRALQEVSFELRARACLGIVGESGCGKSTLARQLTLIENPSSGHITLLGTPVASADAAKRKQLRAAIQMVFQNPYGSLNPRLKIGSQLAEPLRIHTQQNADERRQRVRDMLAMVGLNPDHEQRYAHMFSGGQRQRIAIARAMILRPAIVVADEPTSALDVSIQAQVLNLFRDLQQELGTAYVFISHNLSVIRHVANEVAVMYLGRIVEQAPTQTLFNHAQHPYTLALLAATPTLDLGAGTRVTAPPLQGELPSPLKPPEGCAFHPRCSKAQARCRQEAPVLRKLGAIQIACHFPESQSD